MVHDYLQDLQHSALFVELVTIEIGCLGQQQNKSEE